MDDGSAERTLQRSSEEGKCRLCGLPIGHSTARLTLSEQTFSFCCRGCLYVFQILSERPEGPPTDFLQTDLFKSALAAGVIRSGADNEAASSSIETSYTREFVQERHYRIEGMWCMACAYLIEEVLRRHTGVIGAEVLFFSDLLRIRYLPHQVDPRSLLREIAKLGYEPLPFEEDPGRSHEKKDLLVRLGVSSILTMNIMGISFVAYGGLFRELGEKAIASISYPLLILCTGVLCYGGLPIFHRAAAALRHRTASMDTLISVGSLSAYGYSLYAMGKGSVHLYFDTSAMLITLVLLGRFIELHARDRVTRGINEIASLARQKVRLIVDGKDKWSLPDLVRTGDLFRVRKGERSAVDGRIVCGRTMVDESFLTGESRPLRKSEGDVVTAGSLLVGDGIDLHALSEGSASTLSQMMRLLQNALLFKNPIELFADRVTRLAVPAVLLLAFCTAAILPAAGATWGDSLLRAVTVLVIACPCALGIATPLARVASLGSARRKGILISNPVALERARSLQTMILDKTGTVTEGRFGLRQVIMEEGISHEEGLARACSVEAESDHFIAREILEKARALSISWVKCNRYALTEGQGVRGEDRGREILVGNRSHIQSRGWSIHSPLEKKAGELEGNGDTVVFVAWDGRARGLFSFGDPLRKDAADLVPSLRSRGLDVWLVSGDSALTTSAVAGRLGIEQYKGQALPKDKIEIVRALQSSGRCVAMVGDGINDSAALAQADVGFSLAAKNNLLQQASDVSIISADLRKVIETLDISTFHNRVVRQNLFFSFFYNAIGIPLAVAGYLNPVLAILAMFASSLTVIFNTIRITRKK
ncbi:MAG: cation-translocating P-type ATPase [Desulfobacteraceae bacterium]|nr:MAG: cation-translocating P-type ATPase [Desulfobacteraceae bacterium]